MDFTSCVSDSNLSLRPANGLVASMATFPASPLTFPRASAIDPDGTATRRTSASEASPPSRPSRMTVCPARSQRSASPPPTLPRPMTVMFTRFSSLRSHWGLPSTTRSCSPPLKHCVRVSGCPPEIGLVLADRLEVQRDLHVVADDGAAGLQRLVPADTKLLAADLRR